MLGLRAELFAQLFQILPSVLGLSAAFFVLENLAGGVRRSQGRRWVNYLYLPVALTFVCALQLIAGRLFAGSQVGLLSELIPHPDSPLEEILFGVAFAVAWDVWQYWVHRWQHSSPILWQTHKLHHSDTDVNAGTQARHHILSHAVLILCYAPIIILFGAVTPSLVVAVLMFRVWGFVNHADVRLGFGPLTSVIAGPQWHRIHHSTRLEHLDKNFAAYFPFIDRMFGTYYRPLPDEYPPTGLIDAPPEPFLYEATVSPFVWWYRGLRRTLTRQSKALANT